MGSPFWFLEVKVVSVDEWRKVHARTGSIYFIHDRDSDHVKIGHSRDPSRRLRALQTGNSGRLHLVGIIAAPIEIEKSLHYELYQHQKLGEWFSREVLLWLEARTHGNLLKQSVCERIPCAAREVWWHWNAETKRHEKYIFENHQRLLTPSETKPNARPGWDSMAKESLRIVK